MLEGGPGAGEFSRGSRLLGGPTVSEQERRPNTFLVKLSSLLFVVKDGMCGGGSSVGRYPHHDKWYDKSATTALLFKASPVR